MTPEAWTFLGALVLACAAWMAVTKNRDDLKAANDNLIVANAKLRERATKAERAVSRLLDARPEFRTPGFMAEPVELPEWERELLEAEHIADALDVVEPRNVVRFPGQRGS